MTFGGGMEITNGRRPGEGFGAKSAFLLPPGIQPGLDRGEVVGLGQAELFFHGDLRVRRRVDRKQESPPSTRTEGIRGTTSFHPDRVRSLVPQTRDVRCNGLSRAGLILPGRLALQSKGWHGSMRTRSFFGVQTGRRSAGWRCGGSQPAATPSLVSGPSPTPPSQGSGVGCPSIVEPDSHQGKLRRRGSWHGPKVVSTAPPPSPSPRPARSHEDESWRSGKCAAARGLLGSLLVGVRLEQAGHIPHRVGEHGDGRIRGDVGGLPSGSCPRPRPTLAR